jgi:tryptophan synthase alpha subunit
VVLGSALVEMLGREGVEETRRFVTGLSRAMAR